jgi:phthiodiolone/phenolphthiodiolone dimycocerosates ketoreductase
MTVSYEVEIDTAIGFSRYMPGQAIAQAARAYEASGVIDSVSVWDQLNFFHPPWLWSADTVPSAGAIADGDSFPDPFASLAYASCAAPSLGLSTGTDAVRRGPAELAQSLLTLASMTSGKVTLQLGAGEIKQCKPFGWKRAQGLKRLEDLLQVLPRLLRSQNPIDYEGHYWTLDTAFIGNGAKDKQVRIWGLGGGPKLLDLTTSFADGFSTAAPEVAIDPGHWAEMIGILTEQLIAKERDPDNFDFAIYPACCLIHEDENVLDEVIENPLVRWITATNGHINQSDWQRQGITGALPPDWHYAMHLLPYKIGRAEAEEILGRVTREMVEKAWFIGTPSQVAAQIQEYIDLGARYVHIGDCVPLFTDPDDAQKGPERVIEVARALKAPARTGESAGAVG